MKKQLRKPTPITTIFERLQSGQLMAPMSRDELITKVSKLDRDHDVLPSNEVPSFNTKLDTSRSDLILKDLEIEDLKLEVTRLKKQIAIKDTLIKVADKRLR